MSRGPRQHPGALERLWTGHGGIASAVLAVLTAPLAVLYGTATRGRALGFDHGLIRSIEPPIPVISVGNLAVGGTGKTPVSGWLAGELVVRGFRPALVARGYADDELHLHRRWNPDVPVIRAPRRIAGIRTAAEEGCDVAVLDDAFQHRRVQRDLDIVLLSPAHPLPPRLLPRGPFREPLRALRRADRILVTAKGEAERTVAADLAAAVARMPGSPPVHVLPLVSGEWIDLDGTPAPPPEGVPFGLCAIAQPKGFLEAVRARTGRAPVVRTYRDHHEYSPEEVEAIATEARKRGGWIATTEKDAVKLARFEELLPEVRVLPLVVAPPPGLADSLLEAIERRRPTSGADGNAG